jgi:alpha-beta hydrolase superfamily lysophospholipase
MSITTIRRIGVTDLRCTEHEMASWDGTRLFYRAWRPRGSSRKAVILFHRGHEHSGRLDELVRRLDLGRTSVFAWDKRGHGRSPGRRGHAESFAALIKDVDAFVRHVSSEYDIPTEEVVVMGHSVGSVLVAAWAHDYAPPVRALVLGAPAFRVKLYVPLALPMLRLLLKIHPKATVKSYVKSHLLTHDPEQQDAYDSDPLITRSIAVNILIDLFDTSRRVIEDAGAIRIPTLVQVAGSDWVVDPSAQKEFFGRLGTTEKELKIYDGFYHSIYNEADRARPISDARRFILNAFDRTAVRPSLLKADRSGYTLREKERISAPLPVFSPKRLSFAATKLTLKSAGLLSRGIRIGWKSGFDSGPSLDHVYENRARGFALLGPLLDRMYLNQVGWSGIRERRVILERLLAKAIQAEDRPVRIVDIAAGPGRYLLETLRRFPQADIQAHLRDWDPKGLDLGRRIAAGMGLSNVTFARGDAFDPESLKKIRPRPNIVVVSGLYELFPSNEKVLASLKGVAGLIDADGILIYTNQPWHPQVEMIARVLVNREGKPWIMRRRTQEEMDELVGAAGFRKRSMEIDAHGIFTVSVAERDD